MGALFASALVANAVGCVLLSGAADYRTVDVPSANDAAPDVPSAPPAGLDAGTCAIDDAREGKRCGDACVDTTRDPKHCGSCEHVCRPGSFCDGECRDVVGTLDKRRLEIPCTSGLYPDGHTCESAAIVSMSTTVSGSPGKSYDVRLRFRGVLEQRTYPGGTNIGATDGQGDGGGNPAFFIAGGLLNPSDQFNAFTLEVQPEGDGGGPQTFRLNAGMSGITRCFPIDYVATIRVASGATVAISADSAGGTSLANIDDNGDPIVVPGVPPAPEVFDGQFVQIDVLSVTPTP